MLSVEPFFRFGLIKDVIVLDVDDYFLVCEVLETNVLTVIFMLMKSAATALLRLFL